MSAAFLTGSHVYGIPNAESDVDLVIRIDHDEEASLRNILGIPAGPLKIGPLNLICCNTDEAYALWLTVTRELENSPHLINKKEKSEEAAEEMRAMSREEIRSRAIARFQERSEAMDIRRFSDFGGVSGQP